MLASRREAPRKRPSDYGAGVTRRSTMDRVDARRRLERSTKFVFEGDRVIIRDVRVLASVDAVRQAIDASRVVPEGRASGGQPLAAA